MSMSRVRSRVAAIAGALPVLLAASPVGVAFAAGEYTVQNVVANSQVIGPNVGFLGEGTGVSGTTAMFKIALPSTLSTVTGVRVRLTSDNSLFSLGDLADGDGLALYADLDDDGVFDAGDKATGKRSDFFTVGTSDAAGTMFSLHIPTAATGVDTYFVTIRPSTNARTAQRVRFEVPASGIEGSGGNGPASTISTPTGDNRMVMDSARPDFAPRSAFIVDEKVAGTEDAYFVAPSAASSDPSLKVVFFNNPTDTAPSSILTRKDFDPETAAENQVDQLAVDTVINPAAPTQPHRILIGDGTGIIPGVVAVAKNNQKGNNVYARLMDSAGNLSNPTVLTDCHTTTTATDCPAQSLPDNPHNANNVVAPIAPTGVTFPQSNRINISTETSVSVTAASSADAGNARQGSGARSSDTSTPATKSKVVVAAVGEDGLPDFSKATADHIIAWAASAAHTGINSTPVPEGQVFGIAWNTDDLGNVSAPKVSTSVPKDITRPTLSVELASGAATGSPGQIVTLQFSEPMDTTKITPTAPMPTGGYCQPNTNSTTYVEEVLEPKGLSTADERTWGYNNCFAWATGGAAATIELGEIDPLCAAEAPCPTLAGVGTRVYIKGTHASPKLTDVNGNGATGIGPSATDSGYTTIVAPPARPDVSVPAETRDLNSNGLLDGVVVTFTSGVNLDTFPAAQSKMTAVAGGVSVPITTAEYVLGDRKKVLFGFGGSFGTGATPEIRLTVPAGQASGLVGDDTRPVPAFSALSIDKAVPRIKTAHTVDSNKDGRIDQVIVTFTEQIDHAKDHNNVVVGGQDVSTQPGGYRVVGYEDIEASNRNHVSPNTGFSDTKTITLDPIDTGYDTAATPAVQWFGGAPIVPGDPDRAWYDAAGNKGPFSSSTTEPTATATAADKVAPQLVQRKTLDTDFDGRLDAIDLKFSETIPLRTVDSSSYSVAGHVITKQSGLGPDGIRLEINETAARGRGDTGAKPLVQYLGGMDDGLGNTTTPETAGVAATDTAPPAIVGACYNSPKGSNGLCPEDDPANDGAGNPDKGNKLNVFFSELITNASAVQADFKVEQPAGTDKGTATAAPTFVDSGTGETGFSIATLTFAVNTFNYEQDALVRLAAEKAVTDRASPVNESAQTGNVTAFKFPTVDLEITCPVAATAGHCSQLTVNVDTNSSGGVTLWRLKETPRVNPTPDGDFTSDAIPATHTFAAEGTYKLYLTGKDAYNRVTPEDSAEIRIIKTPKIENVQFLNSTPGVSGGWAKSGTVTDGDNLLMSADAYGSDAAEWASAAVGGGCFAQHMSVDVREVTGKSNLGTVAPLKCDLKTGGQGPFRHMEFPVTKVSNTTRYPVGTVLKTSDSDPGSMIVDGPGGTHRRRAFISVNARRSWMISDASVIKVPSALVAGIPRLSPSIGYRDGALLRSSTGYYLVYRSQKRPVSTAQLSAWRITTRMAYNPTLSELRAMSTGSRLTGSRHPAGVWIKYSNGAIYQIVRNSKGVNVRRRLASSAALKTQVPYGHVVPAVSADNQMPVESWLIGYRDGTLLKHADGTFSVVARASLRRFANPETFNSMGYNGRNALGANGSAMPRVSGQSYRIGVPIDRYKITSVVMKVTNKAGGIATVTINPAIGGLFALGTFDKAPTGWDFTR